MSDNTNREIPINESVQVLGNGEFLNNSSYILAFKITDSITTDNDFIEVLVPSADIPFNIRKGGKGASFGCYSEKDNELTVAWNLNVKGGLVYENAEIEMRPFVEDKRGLARYFPCLEIVIVRLRFTAHTARRLPELLTRYPITVLRPAFAPSAARNFNKEDEKKWQDLRIFTRTKLHLLFRRSSPTRA